MKKVSMSGKDFLSEHKKLIKTLKKPTKKKLRSEIREQSKEVKEYRANRKPSYIG